ncbi:acid phosphatase [Novosphingobium sp. Rr 2-17]|uniref:acid phosphatase n=1 Tax=Novosphingobium sp. Rr 2-17 TaxID=555793 RepID=UPI0002699F40|nr:phosphatase PAP2 family protein [Novosphingobium sp. Rr 2-17]EIZ77353.1 acid phosphatase [Novosphingobium sp. Rr 2-17]
MTITKLVKGTALAAALASGAMLAQDMAGAQQTPASASTSMGAMAPGAMPAPYLAADQLPDSTVLVPPPPAAGSAAMQRDEAGAKSAVAQRGSPRWTLAIADAQLSPQALGADFSCAAAIAIGPQTTPVLTKLLQRATADFAISARPAKKLYHRARPFTQNDQPICTPDAAEGLRKDGSYPSGHSTIGFGTALVLAEVIPSRATALIARGRAFGDSRRICNVHWTSDIEEGRFMASAVFARLNADPAFQADLAAARAEVVRMQPGAGKDCAAESMALAATR